MSDEITNAPSELEHPNQPAPEEISPSARLKSFQSKLETVLKEGGGKQSVKNAVRKEMNQWVQSFLDRDTQSAQALAEHLNAMVDSDVLVGKIHKLKIKMREKIAALMTALLQDIEAPGFSQEQVDQKSIATESASVQDADQGVAQSADSGQGSGAVSGPEGGAEQNASSEQNREPSTPMDGSDGAVEQSAGPDQSAESGDTAEKYFTSETWEAIQRGMEAADHDLGESADGRPAEFKALKEAHGKLKEAVRRFREVADGADLSQANNSEIKEIGESVKVLTEAYEHQMGAYQKSVEYREAQIDLETRQRDLAISKQEYAKEKEGRGDDWLLSEEAEKFEQGIRTGETEIENIQKSVHSLKGEVSGPAQEPGEARPADSPSSGPAPSERRPSVGQFPTVLEILRPKLEKEEAFLLELNAAPKPVTEQVQKRIAVVQKTIEDLKELIAREENRVELTPDQKMKDDANEVKLMEKLPPDQVALWNRIKVALHPEHIEAEKKRINQRVEAVEAELLNMTEMSRRLQADYESTKAKIQADMDDATGEDKKRFEAELKDYEKRFLASKNFIELQSRIGFLEFQKSELDKQLEQELFLFAKAQAVFEDIVSGPSDEHDAERVERFSTILKQFAALEGAFSSSSKVMEGSFTGISEHRLTAPKADVYFQTNDRGDVARPSEKVVPGSGLRARGAARKKLSRSTNVSLAPSIVRKADRSEPVQVDVHNTEGDSQIRTFLPEETRLMEEAKKVDLKKLETEGVEQEKILAEFQAKQSAQQERIVFWKGREARYTEGVPSRAFVTAAQRDALAQERASQLRAKSAELKQQEGVMLTDLQEKVIDFEALFAEMMSSGKEFAVSDSMKRLRQEIVELTASLTHVREELAPTEEKRVAAEKEEKEAAEALQALLKEMNKEVETAEVAMAKLDKEIKVESGKLDGWKRYAKDPFINAERRAWVESEVVVGTAALELREATYEMQVIRSKELKALLGAHEVLTKQEPEHQKRLEQLVVQLSVLSQRQPDLWKEMEEKQSRLEEALAVRRKAEAVHGKVSSGAQSIVARKARAWNRTSYSNTGKNAQQNPRGSGQPPEKKSLRQKIPGADSIAKGIEQFFGAFTGGGK